MSRRGFTLVELLVVLALVGLVAATLALNASASQAEGSRWSLRADVVAVDGGARELARRGSVCRIELLRDRAGVRVVEHASGEAVIERRWVEDVRLSLVDRGGDLDAVEIDVRGRSVDYEVSIGRRTWRVAGRTGAIVEVGS